MRGGSMPERRNRGRRRVTAATGPPQPGSRARREPERAALGVLAHGPALARVDHGAAERLDLLEGASEVVDLEVRQREGVAGAAPARVYADRGTAGAALPAPAP